MLKLKKISLQSEQGFTLIEVLASILILTLFISGTMQAMVVGAVLKSRARESTEAMEWIQQDLENIRSQAVTYQYRPPSSVNYALTNSPAQAATSITLNSAVGFSVNDTFKFVNNPDLADYRITVINSNTLTITPGLQLAKVAGTEIVRTTRCIVGGAPTRFTGFGDGLRDFITGQDISIASNNTDLTQTSRLTNRQFRVRRTTTVPNVAPFNLLEIRYEVAPISNINNTIATFNTELIPNAAFTCTK